jgi:hypothetical protein
VIWSLGLITVARASDDVIIEQGDKAPFKGVLVPPENYRLFVKASVERDITKDMLKNPPAAESQTETMIMSFGVGFTVSSLLFLLFIH